MPGHYASVMPQTEPDRIGRKAEMRQCSFISYMFMLNKIIEPKNISLITTERCTASCYNCCFQCSPQKKRRMSLQTMITRIDEIVRDFPNVISCVFTGGECTTLGNDLIKILEYVQTKNLKSRIVTNGHWAITKAKALSYLKKLHNAGLNELNLSTGDEHQKWIPYDRIVYACQAANQLGIFVAVNIESTSSSLFTSKSMLEDVRVSQKIKNGEIIVKDSLWIDFHKDISQNSAKTEVLNDGPCTNLFNTISISPDDHLFACCGLTCKNNKYLDLGDIQKYSIRKLYIEQFDDLMKLWLYTHGPKKIYTFLCDEKNICDDSFKYPHICSLCHHILNCSENMDIIRAKITDILPSVMLKYQFITTINN